MLKKETPDGTIDKCKKCNCKAYYDADEKAYICAGCLSSEDKCTCKEKGVLGGKDPFHYNEGGGTDFPQLGEIKKIMCEFTYVLDDKNGLLQNKPKTKAPFMSYRATDRKIDLHFEKYLNRDQTKAAQIDLRSIGVLAKYHDKILMLTLVGDKLVIKLYSNAALSNAGDTRSNFFLPKSWLNYYTIE